jgi:CRISPR/Cas system-associated protein Cas5 (RAMP superfamily)
MKNATVPLLKQALREMRQYYTDDKRFGDHLARFQTIMWRSKVMNEPEKREIQEELKMVYQIDRFIDGNPYIENRIEKAVAERAEKIAAERVAQGMQRLILDAIKDRFPALADQAPTTN